MTVAVKICGIRTPAAALAAADGGADLIGLIFAPSRRQVTVEQACTIVEALRAAPAGLGVTVVGVFVDTPAATIADIAATVGLDWAQLSGHEDQTLLDDLTLPAMKALRFDGHPSEAAWLAGEPGCDVLPVVVDAHVAGSFGGAGVAADWQQAASLASRRPVLLAGGLTPVNVAEAVQAVHPWGVDVSSGVETDGAQDLAKIRAFIAAAKQA